MSSLSLAAMQEYLRRSLSSINDNKVNGLKAEHDFRSHLQNLGFAQRISAGGWIARSTEPGQFATHTAVFFPQIILPGQAYPVGGTLPTPDNGLHTICATFHQIGVHSFFCSPSVLDQDDTSTIQWNCIQLGIPTSQNYHPFPNSLQNFSLRNRKYNFLRYNADVSKIPNSNISEEFSKEHLRISFQTKFFSEVSDVDGILWGKRHTYPLEIKEKTSAFDRRVGNYFGLDAGPFVKLAFYAARRGNLHSLFIVREIDDASTRNLVQWRYITFEHLAQVASWTPRSGGTNMMGGGSTTILIPKSEFSDLNLSELNSL